jgi:hypothetical protein
MRGYKPIAGETPALIVFKKEDHNDVRIRKARNQIPFCVNNEREYWGVDMFSLLYGVDDDNPVT